MKNTNSLTVSFINDNMIISGAPIVGLRRALCKFGGKVEAEVGPGGELVIKHRMSRKAVARSIVDEARLGLYDVTWEQMDGAVTICHTYGNGYHRVGYAVCAPGDIFDYDVGRAIAYLRAVGKPVPSILTA